jgi:hypothetical protein
VVRAVLDDEQPLGLDGQPLVVDLLGHVVGDDDHAVDVADRLADAGPHPLPVRR